jgi:bacteriocin biosynthesis cyclodehydratase domain-containing protein
MQDTPTRKEGDPPRLPQRPYLKPWYRLAQTDGRLILEYAHSATVLEGKAVEKLFPVLLPLLDGTRTIEEVSDYVGEDVAPAVANALTTLADHGLLTDGPPLTGDTPAPVAETAQFLAATSVGNQTVAESESALSEAAVAVVGTGSIAREIARLLRVAGATKLTFLDWEPVAAEIDSLDLALVVPEPAELPRLEGWNRRALQHRLAWLQVLPFDGRIAAVGPLYVPDDTCCYECYRRRRAANLPLEEDDFWTLEASPASYPSPPPLQQMIAGLAATLALRWLGEQASGQTASYVPATMHAIEMGETVELSRHLVYRVPRCPACFADSAGTPSPWYS